MVTSSPGRSSAGALSWVWFVEEAQPFVHAAIGSDAKARSSVTLDDELVQIVALLGGQPAEAEIIQDDKIRSQIATEDLVVRMIRARLAQLSQQRVGAHEEHRVAGAHAGRAYTLRQHGLAHAHR